ncbi:hypothetical protein D770_24480 [Flammeovirgaceae bacterium 311]|nr:hypothetical protein D770_24480 [Flammeovirgaceae bacterium 311]
MLSGRQNAGIEENEKGSSRKKVFHYKQGDIYNKLNIVFNNINSATPVIMVLILEPQNQKSHKSP